MGDGKHEVMSFVVLFPPAWWPGARELAAMRGWTGITSSIGACGSIMIAVSSARSAGGGSFRVEVTNSHPKKKRPILKWTQWQGAEHVPDERGHVCFQWNRMNPAELVAR